MIQVQLKLRIKPKQELVLSEWLLVLTRVWNWAIRKIELDGKDGIYYRKKKFQNLLANHGKKLEIPSHTLQGMLIVAWESWKRCFKKLAKKPKLKGIRNRLNSIAFPDPIWRPDGVHIKISGLGISRFYKQDVPEGKIKCGRIVRRASGWYLCLFIKADTKIIPIRSNCVIGIDPGYKSTLTLSSEEKIEKPKQLQRAEKCLAEAQRGKRKKLTARLQERVKNHRKDDNHKLSGKSVAEASHYQLRQMLSYKCTASGRKYIEADSKDSTMTCSNCLAKTGPTGKAGLSVRQWECTECGILHDRDQNAAINTLVVGLRTSLERCA